MSSLRSGTGRLLLALFSAGLAAGCDRQAPDTPQPAPTAAPAPTAGAIDRSHKGEPAPTAAFEAPDGKPITLAAFRGKPVLVNLWAVWCAPCIAELPTLDQAAANGVTVAAIDQDIDPTKAAPFLKAKGATHLIAYRDPKMLLSVAFGGNLPTSIFYDAQGRELWRVTGGMDWAGAAAKALLAER